MCAAMYVGYLIAARTTLRRNSELVFNVDSIIEKKTHLLHGAHER
jgi:hypothetical protein